MSATSSCTINQADSTESDGLIFKIVQHKGITKIVNCSKELLVVSVRPVKPKRKYIAVDVIPAGSFVIWDCVNDKIDLSKLSFHLSNGGI